MQFSDPIIPTHDFANQHIDEIRVVKLGSRSHYNTAIPHRHNYIELFIFRNSGGIHDIDFVTFPIEAYSIHLVSSGRVHKVNRGMETHGYVIMFSPTVFSTNEIIADFLFNLACYDVTENEPIFDFNKPIGEKLISIADNIWDDYNTDDSIKQHFVLSNLTLLLLHCIQSAPVTDQKRSKDQELYVNFRKLVQQNFKHTKKVREYVDILNTTSRKLNEIVSQKTGLSVSQFLYGQIILEAKRLLNTGISSKEVSYELNFDDPAHFSKFFKTQTGISPTEFIKANQ